MNRPNVEIRISHPADCLIGDVLVREEPYEEEDDEDEEEPDEKDDNGDEGYSE